MTQIAKCFTYATRDTCARCDTGYVLQVDKKSCVIMTDAQKLVYKNTLCSAYEVKNTCLQCQKDYYFDLKSENCLKCETDSATCAYCDYKNPKEWVIYFVICIYIYRWSSSSCLMFRKDSLELFFQFHWEWSGIFVTYLG